MSRFLNSRICNMAAYVPGEQPKDRKYIKLNTNECPYPPSVLVDEVLKDYDFEDLKLYPDPTAGDVIEVLADYLELKKEQIAIGGGSDEMLAYTFMAFFQEGDKVFFPDITYGFYKVYADLFGLSTVEVPVGDGLDIKIDDYMNVEGNIVIANPNAPTGLVLDVGYIEKLLKANRERLVVLDEAYIDFSPMSSAIRLIDKYDNLLIIRTFSKSRALAGMRIGMAIGQESLIRDLDKVRFSFNPFNFDRISSQVAIASIKDDIYFRTVVNSIKSTRSWVSSELLKRGFYITESNANFLFVKKTGCDAKKLYLSLKEKGVLIRYFAKERIKDYIRVTIGTKHEMKIFIEKLDEVLIGSESE